MCHQLITGRRRYRPTVQWVIQMDTVNAALEGVERLREQLKQLQQEVKGLKGK